MRTENSCGQFAAVSSAGIASKETMWPRFASERSNAVSESASRYQAEDSFVKVTLDWP